MKRKTFSLIFGTSPFVYVLILAALGKTLSTLGFLIGILVSQLYMIALIMILAFGRLKD